MELIFIHNLDEAADLWKMDEFRIYEDRYTYGTIIYFERAHFCFSAVS